jgi:hypothetical protein
VYYAEALRFLERRSIMFRRLAYLVSFVLVLVAVPLVTHAQVENLMHTDPSFEDEIIINSPGWASWTT